MSPRSGTARAQLAAPLACLFFAAGPLAAHGPLHEQIEALNARIEQEPRAELYLRRGALWGEAGHLDSALADFDQAERLAPELAEVHFARGRTLFRAGQPGPALEALDRFLAREGERPDASLIRARIFMKLGDFRAAARDYERAIAGGVTPEPEAYVERARAHVALGDRELALRGLDQGIAKLGPVVSLELPAIELELECGRHEAALARVGAVAARAPRQDVWLARRGEILEKGGRATDARRAYQAALAALTAARPTRAAQELAARVRAALARLDVQGDRE